jgi:uncharacterized protein (DUF1800 family)
MMALGSKEALAVTALARFGLGARPGDLRAAASDPRGMLIEELRTANIALLSGGGLSSCPAALQSFYLEQQRRQAERTRMAAMEQSAASVVPSGQAPASAPSVSPKPAPPKPPIEQTMFREEALARLNKQLKAPAGFVERLVAFWSNHFAVSVAKGGPVLVSAGPFEREAIRPNVIGRFSALLLAAESHPAMILFLDNQRSIGPNAAAGKFAGRGLNENLGREILELHTLGVGGGYTQADVTELARALTGWSVGEPESESGVTGAFDFKPNWHEPGEREILGKHYAQTGVEQAREALDDLARHPATARHVATKLARHFVADNPPSDLVDALTRRFRESDGDLKAVAEALVADDRAWSAKATKARSPLEFFVAAARAAGFLPTDPGPYLQALNLLGEPLWSPAGPNGFSDSSDAWTSPESMKLRLDLASTMGQRMGAHAEPLEVLNAAFGEMVSAETRQAVERAESREQALALLFMAPEFQRR